MRGCGRGHVVIWTFLASVLPACAPRRAAPVVPVADAFRVRPDGWVCTTTDGVLPLPRAVAFARARAALVALTGTVAADSASGRLVVADPQAATGGTGVGDTPGRRAARPYFTITFDTDSARAGTAFASAVGLTGTDGLPHGESAAYAEARRLGERFWAAMGYPSRACYVGPRTAVPPPAESTMREGVPAAAAPRSPAGREPNLRRMPGAVLEVVGLRRWTLAMLEDSLAARALGTSLMSSGCAQVLRYRLGFADAAVIEYVGYAGDSARHLVVMLVEPGDSARVRHRPVSLDTARAHGPWRDAVTRFGTNEAAFMRALTTYARWRRSPTAPAVTMLAQDTAVAATWRFLASRATATDARLARRLVDASPDYRTRAVAAAVLGNTLADDATVHALVGTLLQSDGSAKAVAAAVLRTLTVDPSRRTVAWGPAAPAVHALLDGTSPQQAAHLLPVLVATGVGPADAPAFLRGGGTMLLAFLASAQPGLRADARALLVALRGADLGPTPDAWRAWMATL